MKTRREKIKKLRKKLSEKLDRMHESIRKEYEGGEIVNKALELDRTPLAQQIHYKDIRFFSKSDHENMLDARENNWTLGPDPVLKNVLNGDYDENTRKGRDENDLYERFMSKAVYEAYLSEVVGRQITIERYEGECGFLSNNGTNPKIMD
tara:strand:- start:1415 stop:1864 length:450 start_codon:yes stop_codon:yes gene_type:complete